MRDCPHCAEQIQDEAIYCKHCRTDVEPPLWITSMRRCPYCAEWIDLEHENCQYCNQFVGTVDLTEPSPFVDSLLSEDFTQELEQDASELGGSEQSDLRPSYKPEPELPESGHVSAPASEPEFEAHSSIWASEAEGRGSFRSQRPPPEVGRRALPTGLLQALAAIAVIGGLGYGLVALARGPAGAVLAETLATRVPAEALPPEPTATRSTAPTLPPETQTALDPTSVGSVETGECVLWDQITLDDEGSELCAYGVIRRWFAVSQVPFVAIFTEETGTFAIVDRTTTHPVGPGDCIVARGPVEVMSRTRPDIDLNGTLELCPEEWLPDE